MVSVGALLAILAALAKYGPLLLLLAAAAWFLWDKNRVLVLGWDPETDKVYPKKARPTKDVLRVSFPGAPEDPAIKLNTSLKGEWQGLFYPRPVVVVNTRTGNQMGRVTLRDSETEIEQLFLKMRSCGTWDDYEDGEPPLGVLAEIANPMVLARAMDGDHVAQLNNEPVPKWLVWAMLCLAFLVLAWMLYMLGSG